MTGKDIMTFGKFKGLPLEKVDKGYISWFLQQDWTEEKYPDLFEFWSGGGVPTTQNEAATLEDETRILQSMPPDFSKWWLGAYGRLRTSSPDLYIPYLRVAVEGWSAALRPRELDNQKPGPLPQTPPPVYSAPPKSNYTPPPMPKKRIEETFPDEDVPF